MNEDMPESAAKAVNRRNESNTNNGGDGNDSETIKRCRPGTCKTIVTLRTATEFAMAQSKSAALDRTIIQQFMESEI